MTRSTDYAVAEVSLNGDIYKMHLTHSFMKLNNMKGPPFPAIKNLREYIPPEIHEKVFDAIKDVVCCRQYVEFPLVVDYSYRGNTVVGNRTFCIWPHTKDRVLIATIMSSDREVAHGKWIQKKL